MFLFQLSLPSVFTNVFHVVLTYAGFGPPATRVCICVDNYSNMLLILTDIECLAEHPQLGTRMSTLLKSKWYTRRAP
ncbi:hypothetical protein BD626DRAFT_133166 [Schizophyllum amplum]|uniref:Secreted protein n=1 Tax=Schizophyllum amplum TaxID=97359 RepID=A0A550C6P8_9AGAR|nr:hypothetical protein BD626DRAFT_133166 [Auriculariopsis ampla]